MLSYRQHLPSSHVPLLQDNVKSGDLMEPILLTSYSFTRVEKDSDCYFTGIIYVVVRQMSMLFIDNKDSVF